jgi:hypothetical protein
MVEFTVSEIKVEPCGTDLHLFIDESPATLIEQLCDDGFEQEVVAAVDAWKKRQVQA